VTKNTTAINCLISIVGELEGKAENSIVLLAIVLLAIVLLGAPVGAKEVVLLGAPVGVGEVELLGAPVGVGEVVWLVSFAKSTRASTCVPQSSFFGI
jgi:hypothetical protein